MKFDVYTTDAGKPGNRFFLCVPEAVTAQDFLMRPDVAPVLPLLNRFRRTAEQLAEMGIDADAVRAGIAAKGYYVGTVTSYAPIQYWSINFIP